MSDNLEVHPVLTCWRPRVHDQPPVPWARVVRKNRVLWPPPGEPYAAETIVNVSRDIEPWRCSIRLWLHRSTMSPVETGLILQWLEDSAGVDLDFSDAMELLGRNPSRVWYDTLLELTDLPEPLQMDVEDGELSPRLIRYLRELPDEWKRSIYRHLADGTIRLSVQEARKLVEASHRWSPEPPTRWIEVLHESTGDSPRDRGKAFLETVRARAYPTLQNQRRAFADDVSDLNLDGRIQVQPPTNFEGDYLDFKLRCKRNDSLESLAEELKRCRFLFDHV